MYSQCASLHFQVQKGFSLTLVSLSHSYCIDHNNVSGDTPFHGHSSETELHKPFTTRSPWWMAGPPAKAPRPDRSAFLSDKCHEKDIWHLSISCSFKWEYVCDRKKEIKKTKQTKKNHMGFCHTKNCKKQYSSIFCFLAPILFVVCVEVILPVLQRSVQLSHFDWFIIERERGRERENKGECTNCMNQVLLVFQLLHSMHTQKKVSMMSIQLVCTIQLQRWQAVQQVLSHHGSLTWLF